MTGTENKALYIAEQCRKAGMTLAGAAGILANIEAESAFKSTNLEDSKEIKLGMNDAQYTARVDSGSYTRFTLDEAGYGLCQWTAADRKEKMLSFHRKRGVSIGDFRTQIDWMLQEIRGYSYAWNKVSASNSPFDCGYSVCKFYEIPADTEKKANHRGGLAQTWYSFLAMAMESGAESDITEELAQDPRQATAAGEGQKTDGEGLPIPETWPPRTVDAHCSGWPEVWLLQSVMKCHGFNVLIDGIWGTVLTDKVKAFQRESGLDADGVVGKNTWIKLGLSPAIFERRK